VPLYEYRCSICGRRFEVLQRVGEGPEGLTCPACGRSEIDREASTFAGAASGGRGRSGGCAPGSRFT
jgi:putative FmdB family regulatory protein